MSVEEENIILKSPDVDEETKLSSLVKSTRRFTVCVIPKQMIIEADTGSIESDVSQIEWLGRLCQEVIGEFSVAAPVLYSPIVERVQVDRAD